MLRSMLKIAEIAGVAAALAQAATLPAAAQQSAGPARSWASVFLMAYPGVGAFNSPVGSDTLQQRWNFGSGFGLGAAVAHAFGPSLELGAEGSFAPSLGVEVTNPVPATGGGFTTTTTSGHARLGSLMATGRIMTGGGGGLGLYLAGGAGVVFWGMPAPASSTTDFAVRTAAGLEYQLDARHGIFLEWGQFWAFHKHHGVSSNTVKYSQIRGGFRFGW